MFLSFILMNMENFCKGGGDGFRRFNGFANSQSKCRVSGKSSNYM